MSIFTGHASTQREQPVQRSLNSAAASSPPIPASHPVAMPPEYVSPPNACPPTCWKFAHEFEHAPHRTQYSVSRKSSSSRMSMRPLSKRTRWKSRSSAGRNASASKSGIGVSTGGVRTDTYWLIACPVAALESNWTNGSRSATVGTSFSTPATATWVSGVTAHFRALPSFVTSAIDPESAATKFAPVMPTSASRTRSPR